MGTRERIRRRIVDPDWVGRVLLLGCIVCDQKGIYTPAEPHHLTRGDAHGKRDDDLRVAPLCYLHHRGGQGIHWMGKASWVREYGTEERLLEKTREQLVVRGFVDPGDPRLREILGPGEDRSAAVQRRGMRRRRR